MKRRIMVLTVAALALAALTWTSASPAFARPGAAGTNAECARCHERVSARSGIPAAAFAAGVSYSKCRTCHWLSSTTPVGYYTHDHWAGTSCRGCHSRYASGSAFYANVSTAAGYFTTANYRLSASEMHRIHARGSWPQSGAPAACASCHAPAACDACHSVPASHSAHAYNSTSRDAQYAPVLQRVTRGTPVEKAATLTARIQGVSCVNALCHVVGADGSVISKPTCDSCHPAFAAFRSFAPVTTTTSRTVKKR
jgi:hypothetical protein